MQWFNHHSVLIVGILIAIGVGSTIVRRGNRTRDWLILAGTLVVYFGAWFALRPVSRLTPPVPGKPFLVEVQSPYCFACVAAKPAVDRLEAELRDKLVIRRVDIRSPEGQQLVREHQVQFTPTFLLFDATGKEQWRGSGSLDAERVRGELAP